MKNILLSFIIILIKIKTLIHSQTRIGYCPRTECRPQYDCLCPGIDKPPSQDGLLQTASTPQFVVFTFQGNVNQHFYDALTEIFGADLLNPKNIGRLSSTIFVSDQSILGKDSDYCAVGKLFHESGHEIAPHSITYRGPADWWQKHADYENWLSEIEGQRRKIWKESGIPIGSLVGWRAPYFGRNEFMFNVLMDRQFQYDSTIVYEPKKIDERTTLDQWPFTLDYPNSCDRVSCPGKSYPGLWEFPVTQLVDGGGDKCLVMNECVNKPKYKGEAYRMLLDNFNFAYSTTKTPIVFSMTTQYLIDYPDVKNGIKQFLETILDKGDVFVIDIQRLLSWMREPKVLSGIETVHGLKERKEKNYDCSMKLLGAPVAAEDRIILFDWLDDSNGFKFLVVQSVLLVFFFFIVYFYDQILSD